MAYGGRLLETTLREALRNGDARLVRERCRREPGFEERLVALTAHLRTNLAPYMLAALARELRGADVRSEAALERAIDEVSRAAQILIEGLVTNAPARDREVVAERARARSRERFGAAAGG